MAESFALAACVIAVLQITNSVISVCQAYHGSAAGAPTELSLIETELGGLRQILQTLEPLAMQAEFTDAAAGIQLPTLALLCGHEGLLQSCLEEMTHLERKLKPPDWSNDFGPKKKALIRALQWPLKDTDAKKTLEMIGRFKSTLVLALSVDEATLAIEIKKLALSTNEITLSTQQDVRATKTVSEDVQTKLDTLETTHQRQAIHTWLAASDPSTNYYRAQKSRTGTTGSWLLEKDVYNNWVAKPNSLLWLHGKPGCGKTVLSSTIITDISECLISKPGRVVIYFYFDFNDASKQTPLDMLCSLAAQLVIRPTSYAGRLDSLFRSCMDGKQRPDTPRLLALMKDIMEGFDEVYVALDALDECTDWTSLLDILSEIHEWNLNHLHLVVTSRREPDLEKAIESLTESKDRVDIQSDLVNADILAHLEVRLRVDSRLKRWQKRPEVQDEIKAALLTKSDGMFRWVVCQLDELKNCFNLKSLRKALASLPRTLDETYSRILCRIPEIHRQDAIKTLQWLVCSVRPLRVEELAEVIAINPAGNPRFDADMQLSAPEDVLEICSSLVVVEETTVDTYEKIYGAQFAGHSISIIRLAHFSVQEYLLSPRINDQAVTRYAGASAFAIQNVPGNATLARDCLTYLLHFDNAGAVASERPKEFPLSMYAARFWTHHASIAEEDLLSDPQLVLELLLVKKDAYTNMLRLYNPVSMSPFLRVRDLYLNSIEIMKPLHITSTSNLPGLTRLLLATGADVNAESGMFGTALQTAAAKDHEAIVKILLENGADANAKTWLCDSALLTASEGGYKAITQLLLEHGANVDIEGRFGGSALRIAANEGHKDIVRLLLEHGANANGNPRGLRSSPLHLASHGGFKEVIQLLLENGADINARDRDYGTALQAACRSHEKETVKLLLQNGAEIHEGFSLEEREMIQNVLNEEETP